MATAFNIFAAVAVAALAMSGAAACSTTAFNAGLFADNVPWGCMEPFNCFVDFCTCVDGQLSSSCTPFGDVNTTTIENCAARRVTCTLNEALKSRNVWNTSCQMWGDSLAAQYATYYADRSYTNLTEACMADMCGVVAAGTSIEVAGSVNLDYICSFVGFSFPAPLDRDDVAGCAISSRTYFEEIPIMQCSGAANCSMAYCSCVNGTWNMTTKDCAMPVAQPEQGVLESCLAVGVGCLAGAALDVYVPGASALNADPCQEWAVPIAEDYATYYNATLENATITKQSTELWKACNYTACKDVFRFNNSADFSSVCSFTALAGRLPTFEAYNPCPYSCPDNTCAANLASCACAAHAAITGLDATFTRDVESVLDMTKSLAATAFASYGVPEGKNCSSFDFSTSLGFAWKLSNASGTVLTGTSSAFTIPASTMWIGTYTVAVTATGLVSTQTATADWMLTVVAPTPTVSLPDSLRISTTKSVAIAATVVDILTGAHAWSCESHNVSTACPSITNSTSRVLYIQSPTPAGTFTITFTYRDEYSSSLTLTVVAGAVPYARIIVPTSNTFLSTNPYAFIHNQQINLASSLDFVGGGAVTYNWTINGGSRMSPNTTLTTSANSLMKTTLSAANAKNYVWNTINLRVTSVANTNVFGEATLRIVVLEELTATLNIAKQGSMEMFATALQDKLVFTYTTTPSLSSTTAPFGASLDASIVYYTFLNNRESSGLGLATTPSGAARVGTAPLFANQSLTSRSMKFSIQVRLNGIVAATANNTFNITKGDINAAAANVLASADSIKDSNLAVGAINDIGAIMGQTSNATLLSQMATKGLAMISANIKTGTTLTVTQSLTVVVNIGSILNKTTGSKTNASKQVFAVFTTVIASTSFDLDVADALGDAIAEMDDQTGGELAIKTVIAASGKVLVGQTKSISMGTIGTMTSTSQTGASLASLKVEDTSGAIVELPSSILADLPGLSEFDIYGVATAVLKTSPFASTIAPTNGVVTYDLTKNGAVLTVGSLSRPIVITMPTGTTGTCQFFHEATLEWNAGGLVTIVTETTIQCYTTHLTAFGGFSSASTAALSALVVALVALMQLAAV